MHKVIEFQKWWDTRIRDTLLSYSLTNLDAILLMIIGESYKPKSAEKAC